MRGDEPPHVWATETLKTQKRIILFCVFCASVAKKGGVSIHSKLRFAPKSTPKIMLEPQMYTEIIIIISRFTCVHLRLIYIHLSLRSVCKIFRFTIGNSAPR